MIEFANKLWLFLLPVAVVLILLLFQIDRRGRRANIRRFASDRLVQDLLKSYSPLRKRLKSIVLLLGVCFLFLALARPQWGHTWTESRSRGIDIVFALDTSRSMLAQDIKPNRLIRSKLAIEDFVNQLEGDRIGLVAFSGSAFLQCPLTLDYDAFFQSLDAVDTNVISAGGTDLSAAIKESESAFSADNNFKIVILITDGEDLEGSGIAQAELSAENNVTIYTVGVGTAEGAPIPLRTRSGRIEYVRDQNGEVVQSRLESETLETIAQLTGGFYVPLGTTGYGLEQVLEAGVGSIPEEEISSQLQRTAIERFQWPLGISLFFFALEPLIGTRRKWGFRSSSGGFRGVASGGSEKDANESERRTGRPPKGGTPTGDSSPTINTGNKGRSAEKLTIFVTAGVIALFAPTPELGAQTPPPAGKVATETAEKTALPSAPETAFARAVAERPLNPVAHFNRGTELYEAEDYTRASKFFTEALRLSSDFAFQADVFYNLGNTRYREGLFSFGDTSPGKVTETATTVSGQNQPPMQNGRQILQAARTQPPPQQQIQQAIGALEQRKTATEESIQSLDSALTNETAVQQLWQRSINDFESALELDPAHDDAAHNLAFVKKQAAGLAGQIAAQKNLRDDQKRQNTEIERLIEELKKLLEDQQNQDQQNQDQQQQDQEQEQNEEQSQDQEQQDQQNQSEDQQNQSEDQQQSGQEGEQSQNQEGQQSENQDQSSSEDSQSPENQDPGEGQDSESEEPMNPEEQGEEEASSESSDAGEEGAEEEPSAPEPEGQDETGAAEDSASSGESEESGGEQEPLQLSEEQAEEIAEELAASAGEAGEQEAPGEGEEVVIGVMSTDDAARLLDSLKRSERKLPFAGSGSEGSPDRDNRKNW